MSEIEFKPFTKMPRLRDEYMYITEKLDGTNAQVFIYEKFSPETDVKVDLDEIEAFPNKEKVQGAVPVREMRIGSRNRYINSVMDNYGFAGWCYEHKEELMKLPPGRHYGEWWGPGIQRGYSTKFKQFSMFNQSLRAIKEIIPCINFAPILYEGEFNLEKIEEVMNSLKENGSAASPGFMEPEGVVIYLKKANLMFKKTYDDRHKGELAA